MSQPDIHQPPALGAREFQRLLHSQMPQTVKAGVTVEEMRHGLCRLRLPPNEDMIRPGGTVSGPSMFALADVALFGAVLSMIGPVALAVTSSMTINFLRKPAIQALVAEARIIRLGRRLAYGEVTLWSEGEEEPVAHATGSYAIPGTGPGPADG